MVPIHNPPQLLVPRDLTTNPPPVCTRSDDKPSLFDSTRRYPSGFAVKIASWIANGEREEDVLIDRAENMRAYIVYGQCQMPIAILS